MDSGWIRLHRRIRDSHLWPQNQRFTPLEAWLDILLSANHTPVKILFGIATMIPVGRGQFVTSQAKLATKWKWDRKTVRKFLLSIENERMVDIKISKGRDIGFTTITIRNYSKYQDKENDQGTLEQAPMDIKKGEKEASSTQSNPQPNTRKQRQNRHLGDHKHDRVPNQIPINKKKKEEEGGDNESRGDSPLSSEFQATGFLEMYASSAPTLPQPRQVTNGRMRKVALRLKAQPTPEFWHEVFTKANQTPFLKGENNRGWRADFDWFVTNDENALKVLEGRYDQTNEVGGKPPDPWSAYAE